MSAAEKLWGRVFAEKKPAPVDPLRAFERVLEERERLYDELRTLTLELIYRRQRASAEIQGWRFEVARLHAAEREAERGGRRTEAEILSEERRRLASDVCDAEDALLEAGREVDEAKRRLGELAQEIARLGFERRSASARLTAQRFRTCQGRPISEGAAQALEQAREALEQARAERSLDRW